MGKISAQLRVIYLPFSLSILIFLSKPKHIPEHLWGKSQPSCEEISHYSREWAGALFAMNPALLILSVDSIPI